MVLNSRLYYYIEEFLQLCVWTSFQNPAQSFFFNLLAIASAFTNFSSLLHSLRASLNISLDSIMSSYSGPCLRLLLFVVKFSYMVIPFRYYPILFTLSNPNTFGLFQHVCSQCHVFLTRFNKIAIQGTPQMAVDKEAISLSRVYSYDFKCTCRYSMCNPP